MEWISVDPWLIGLLSIGYLSLLFFVAYWGQKQTADKWRSNPYVYALGLGVSCTSWAFYGIIGQVATTGYWLSPIYIGTISCFIFGWPLLFRMLKVSKEHNITSLADFIACRYSNAVSISATITIITLLATIPYLALQLRAISTSFYLVTGEQGGFSCTTITAVTLVLIGFSISFGARQLTAAKQNQGLLFALAFSSIIKLIAILAVGIFTTYFIFDGFQDITGRVNEANMTFTASNYLAITHILLGFVTIFVIPQLFHIIVIENYHEGQLIKARWLYPSFLILFNIFVFPIAMAGNLVFNSTNVSADTYILSLPLAHNAEWLSILVYIGGLAAATGMVIIASVVLSTMLTTEVFTPSLIQNTFLTSVNQEHMSGSILNLRRLSIALVLLLSLLFERIVQEQKELASIGLVSFVLLAQFAPAVIAALYWRKASSIGALIGILAGALVWFYSLLLPILVPKSDIVIHGLFNIIWLKPGELLGLGQLGSASNGTICSLLFNIICFGTISLFTTRDVGEQLQAEAFLKKEKQQLSYTLSYSDLEHLLNRFIGREALEKFVELKPSKHAFNQHAPVALVDYTQRQLSAVLGTASTRLVMNAATNSQERTALLEEVAHIVDEANRIFELNREFLQAGVEIIEQGICVLDADMKLVAWNKRYIQLLNYPKSFIKAGMPVEQLIEFNIQRQLIVTDDIETTISKRVNFLKLGGTHSSRTVMPNGVILAIHGQSMPNGGFVCTFTDITKHVATEKRLKRANELLAQHGLTLAEQ